MIGNAAPVGFALGCLVDAGLGVGAVVVSTGPVAVGFIGRLGLVGVLLRPVVAVGRWVVLGAVAVGVVVGEVTDVDGDDVAVLVSLTDGAGAAAFPGVALLAQALAVVSMITPTKPNVSRALLRWESPFWWLGLETTSLDLDAAVAALFIETFLERRRWRERISTASMLSIVGGRRCHD